MKHCTRCQQFKSLEAFPHDKRAKDGRASRCNACMSEIQTIYRATSDGHKARCEATARYQKSPKGRAKRAKYARSEKGRAQRQAYAQTEKGREILKKSQKKYRRKIRETTEGRLKLQAQMAVGHAVERGEIPPASSLRCKQCGYPAKHYHHDLGYAKRYWLHVIPVCLACHCYIHHPTK